MKKSIGIFLIVLIVLLLILIAVGSAFFINTKNATSKEIAELKKEVSTLKNENVLTNEIITNETDESNKASQNTIEVSNSNNQNNKTMKDMVGEYYGEAKMDSDVIYGARLYLAEDATFGLFLEFGAITGSYTVENNKVYLNCIFSHGSDVSLNVYREKRILTIKNDELLADNFLYDGQKDFALKKVSNNTTEFDIRQSLRENIDSDYKQISFDI